MHTPHDTPLISADDLVAGIDDPSIRIADVRWFLGEPDRGPLEYRQAHIPGAVFVDLDRDLAADSGAGRHPLPQPAVFAARMAELGFGDDHTIVIYDSVKGQFGARMWWMLDRLGHRRTLMLDGGLGAWEAVGGPLTSVIPRPTPTVLTLKSDWPGITDREAIAAAPGGIDLVDVRAAERYSGETEPMEQVAGHIPGARNRPCASMLEPDGHLKPAAELLPLVRGEGERAELPLVISCGSGVTACFGMLAARIAGLPDPVLYPGSFSDWAGSGMPVVTGTEPEGPLAVG